MFVRSDGEESLIQMLSVWCGTVGQFVDWGSMSWWVKKETETICCILTEVCVKTVPNIPQGDILSFLFKYFVLFYMFMI